METQYAAMRKSLMKKWAEKELHKDKGFIVDGIIDVARWKNAKRKIVFLLNVTFRVISSTPFSNQFIQARIPSSVFSTSVST